MTGGLTMSNHPIEGLMNSAMENLKTMIDVNTIIGDPVETPDGSVILTVSKVGFGYAAGGSDYQTKQQSQSSNSESGSKNPFGGGSAGGVSITPIAFLIVNNQGVRMLHLDESTHIIEKVIEAAPTAMDKVSSMLNKMKGSGNKESNQNDDKEKQAKKDSNSDEKQEKKDSDSGEKQNKKDNSSDSEEGKESSD